MSIQYAKAEIQGFLAGDPFIFPVEGQVDLRDLDANKQPRQLMQARIPVLVNESFTSQGQKKTRIRRYNVVMWGNKRIRALLEYAPIGTHLLVEGTPNHDRRLIPGTQNQYEQFASIECRRLRFGQRSAKHAQDTERGFSMYDRASGKMVKQVCKLAPLPPSARGVVAATGQVPPGNISDVSNALGGLGVPVAAAVAAQATAPAGIPAAW